jgi:hypothetical protein
MTCASTVGVGFRDHPERDHRLGERHLAGFAVADGAQELPAGEQALREQGATQQAASVRTGVSGLLNAAFRAGRCERYWDRHDVCVCALVTLIARAVSHL